MGPAQTGSAYEGQVAAHAELIQKLRQHAQGVRRKVLMMAKGKGEGYVGQGLDAADILTALYFHEMRFDPQHLDWPDRDRFLLSTGHYAIVLFATLAELGVFSEQELATYGGNDSRLEMASSETTPGVEITGGSLGHGLSQAVGMALGSRLSGRNFRVFNFLSDGELQEGATWEAAMAASHHALDNLVALVDVNNVQADGQLSSVLRVEPVTEKWKAFGWHSQAIDGNSMEQVVGALKAARNIAGQPKAIVCYTLMGKGVPLIEQRPKAHFVRVESHEWDIAISQLEAGA